MSTTLTLITALGACRDACEWAADYPDPQEAWDSCPRGDWLAWYLGKLAARAGQGSPEHRRAVLVACLCARTAAQYAGDHRQEIERLLSQVEDWARGDESVDLAAVRDRMWETRHAAATNAAAYDAAYAAAYDAADAAYAAADAAYAAYAAFAADAAYAAAWHNARRDHLAALADLIRAAVPVVPLPGGE